MACETLDKVDFIDLKTGDLFIGCDEVCNDPSGSFLVSETVKVSLQL